MEYRIWRVLKKWYFLLCVKIKTMRIKSVIARMVDRTVITIIWGKVNCPYCGMEHDFNTQDNGDKDKINCIKCRKLFIAKWE